MAVLDVTSPGDRAPDLNKSRRILPERVPLSPQTRLPRGRRRQLGQDLKEGRQGSGSIVELHVGGGRRGNEDGYG